MASGPRMRPQSGTRMPTLRSPPGRTGPRSRAKNDRRDDDRRRDEGGDGQHRSLYTLPPVGRRRHRPLSYNDVDPLGWASAPRSWMGEVRGALTPSRAGGSGRWRPLQQLVRARSRGADRRGSRRSGPMEDREGTSRRRSSRTYRSVVDDGASTDPNRRRTRRCCKRIRRDTRLSGGRPGGTVRGPPGAPAAPAAPPALPPRPAPPVVAPAPPSLRHRSSRHPRHRRDLRRPRSRQHRRHRRDRRRPWPRRPFRRRPGGPGCGPRSRRAGRIPRPAVPVRERPRSAGAAQRHDDPCCCAEIEPHAVDPEVKPGSVSGSHFSAIFAEPGGPLDVVAEQ